ncbi:protein of unknown function [Aureimonas altamirensis DSM 21988]|uniref:DUF4112 domain-containing protein n=1 Tax=Aureimonas altamirensis DSM 21988 TaxID=1121026 RepID=A0ABY1IMY4_9HYPH|nr:DUF4112 domain-containing protein [Aureimonas altamirensis]UHD47553.1 DUF4112 domain-containing protein [Aureimonas altamirensis]SHJ51911.1 protein of unknown function [Aureimonas altamirensis DSM 21988]
MATVEYILPGEAVRGMSRDEKLRRIRRLAMVARVMDTALRLPGTNIRFGADALMGMVPIFGDAAGALVGLLIVNEARQLGVPKRKLMTMLYNIGVDTAFGAVPVVGDAFDVYYKAHRRNIQIILDHHGLEEGDTRR